MRRPRSAKKPDGPHAHAPDTAAGSAAFTGPPAVPKDVGHTLVDIGRALTGGLLRSLLWRLQAGTCESCGYDGLSTHDLTLIHRVLQDNEFQMLREAAAREAKKDAPVPVTFELPYVENLQLPE